jgi:hypothetical protein
MIPPQLLFPAGILPISVEKVLQPAFVSDVTMCTKSLLIMSLGWRLPACP